jgi:AcrR family transcriptional regulator
MTAQTLTKTHTRVRRGNLEDHAAVRTRIVEAAFRLYRIEEGIEGVSMRALAAELGLSAMGLYRYYESKGAVLQAMWEVVLENALTFTRNATDRPEQSARQRLDLSIDAFMRYWEQHPEHFTLVYMNKDTLGQPAEHQLTQHPAYQDAVRHGNEIVEEFIAELGGEPDMAAQACDLRMAMMVGYLHASLVNKRFPWSCLAALRHNATQAIMMGIEACVQAAPKAPASTLHSECVAVNV